MRDSVRAPIALGRRPWRLGSLALLLAQAVVLSCLLAASSASPADEPGPDAPQSVAKLSDFAADGEKLLAAGDNAGAIDQFTWALQVHPDTPQLLERRAAAYRLSGETLLAEEDLAEAQRLRLAPRQALPPGTISAADAASIGIIAWLILAGLFVILGRKQMIEADGTIRRLLWVSAVAAFLGLGPLLVWLGLHACLPVGPDAVITGSLTFLCILWMNLTLRPMLRVLPLQKPFPLVDDQAFVTRIAELAALMHIRPPRVRVWRTAGGQLKALAWAGGLVQPSLVITDGILHRLSGAERDAIVAHEMGHIANHSLWPLLTLFPLCSLVVPVLEIWYPGSGFPVMFGFLLLLGLRRIVSRPIEADCDRRAARAIGYPETISALAKIHAAMPLRSRGWLPMLGFAMATHPSLDVRLSLLHRAWRRDVAAAGSSAAAGSDFQGTASLSEPIQGFVYSARRFWAHRVVSCIALTAWAAVLTVAVVWSRTSAEDAVILLLAAAIVPSLPLILAATPEARRSRKRLQVRGGTGWLGVVGMVLKVTVVMMAGAIVAVVVDLDGTLLLLLFAGLSLVLLIVPAFRRRKLLSRIHGALEDRDFAGSLRLATEHPKLVARNPALRYLLAVVNALHGERATGIEELEKLAKDYPRYALPQLALASLYLDNGEPERSLETAVAAEQRFRKDPAPALDTARALRRLGRPLEAKLAIERALRLDPSLGAAHAIAAAVALDLGQADAAQQSLHQALELGPGEILVLAIAAEIAVAKLPALEARQAIQEALAAIRANPFAVLETEVAWLVEQLRTMDAEQAISKQPDHPQESAAR